MIWRCSAFSDQPSSTNRMASQSSSSGCEGVSPSLPKLSTERTSPRPKCQRHARLTITRAVSGFRGPVSHRASSSRPLDFGGHRRLARAGQDRRKPSRHDGPASEVIAAQEDLQVADAAVGDRHRLRDCCVFLLGLVEERGVGRRSVVAHVVRVAVDDRVVVAVDDLLEVFQPKRGPRVAEGRRVPLRVNAMRRASSACS